MSYRVNNLTGGQRTQSHEKQKNQNKTKKKQSKKQTTQKTNSCLVSLASHQVWWYMHEAVCSDNQIRIHSREKCREASRCWFLLAVFF